MLLAKIMNWIHVLFLFIPFLIYGIPKAMMPHSFIYLYLGILLVPLHWGLCDDMCLLTILTQKVGGLQNTTTDSAFSEVYLRWLYEPILTLFGEKWTNKTLSKMIYLHWIVLFILLWYYMFFFNKQLICGV